MRIPKPTDETRDRLVWIGAWIFVILGIAVIVDQFWWATH